MVDMRAKSPAPREPGLSSRDNLLWLLTSRRNLWRIGEQLRERGDSGGGRFNGEKQGEAIVELAIPVGLPMGDARTVKGSLGPIKGGMRGVKDVESGSGVP